MAGLGTMFIALMGVANIQRFRGRLETSHTLLWMLMLAFPFPFIATTAGWMTTELIGMAGLSFVLGLLYLFLVGRESMHGPGTVSEEVAHV
jgi:cytochrome bd ubiquinol oxidase subunit I